MDLTVTTTSGRFTGTKSRGTRRWVGIPYAAPPVGDLRFQAPHPIHSQPPQPQAPTPAPGQAHPAQVAPTSATHFSTPVPQFDPDGTGPKRNPNDTNWLTVNVWAPLDPPARPAPVMVWIHGGAYVLGSASNPLYVGAPFAAAGVVFVSVNYRLGIEGFMQFPDAPANRGLLDQMAALRWVRDNAAAFGGDPANVTVFGESAGAGSIYCLLKMPAAQGLFDRAILQSPPAMVVQKALAEDVTREFATLAQVQPTARAFAALSPEDGEQLMVDFARSQMKFMRRWGKATAFTPPLCPVVDGDVLPANPWSLPMPHGVDILVGHNRDEFRMFVDPAQPVTRHKAMERVALVGPGSRVLEDARAGSGAEVGAGARTDVTEASARARELNAAYLAVLDADAGGHASAEQIFERVQSDYMFTVPTLLTALEAQHRGTPGDTGTVTPGDTASRPAHSEASRPAYVYFFALDPAGGQGSPHVAELPPLFDSFRTLHGLSFYPSVSQADHALGARMRQAWVQFATTGDPGWGAWTHEAPTTRVFSYEDVTVNHPLMARFKAFAVAPSRPLGLVPPASQPPASQP